jgi:hypothetical protein
MNSTERPTTAHAKERADREASEAYLRARGWNSSEDDSGYPQWFCARFLNGSVCKLFTFQLAVEAQIKEDAAALAFVLARVSFVAKWKDGSETVVDMVGATIEAEVKL